MIPNPFIAGNPVSPDRFFDRRRPIRRVVGRLLGGGQSTAVIGEPRTGKTSLLHYLAAPEVREAEFGPNGQHYLFSFLDVQVLGGEYTQARFWEVALEPLRRKFVDPTPELPLARQYALCHQNDFGTFTLEALFRRLREQGRWLVLLLDEFDVLLHHPILNSAEFFGGMRSLASRSGSLAIVVASRLPLAELNSRTQQFNPTGSPFFNIFSEVTLGPLPEEDVVALLAMAGNRFTAEDRAAIRAVAGGHPFLLQAAAAAMWDAWEEQLAGAEKRAEYLRHRLYRECASHFANTWRIWSPGARKVFTTVALAHSAQLLPGRRLQAGAFLESLQDWEPELIDLEAAGLLLRDEQVPGGWRISCEAMLWWLADELLLALRPETPFDSWLRAQEMDGLLTRSQRETLLLAIRETVTGLRQGGISFIEAVAQGLASGLIKPG